jgi:opacity protein-like surface antigen
MLRTLLNGSICLAVGSFVLGSTALANPRMAGDVPWFAGINYVDHSFGDIAGEGVDGDGLSIYAGYEMNKRVALEPSYSQIDIDTLTLGATNLNDEEINYLAFSVTYAFDDWQGAVPYARVGFADMTENVDVDGVRVELSGRGFYGGIGVLYTVSPNVALRVEYQHADSDNHNWSIGPKISF